MRNTRAVSIFLLLFVISLCRCWDEQDVEKAISRLECGQSFADIAKLAAEAGADLRQRGESDQYQISFRGEQLYLVFTNQKLLSIQRRRLRAGSTSVDIEAWRNLCSGERTGEIFITGPDQLSGAEIFLSGKSVGVLSTKAGTTIPVPLGVHQLTLCRGLDVIVDRLVEVTNRRGWQRVDVTEAELKRSSAAGRSGAPSAHDASSMGLGKDRGSGTPCAGGARVGGAGVPLPTGPSTLG